MDAHSVPLIEQNTKPKHQRAARHVNEHRSWAPSLKFDREIECLLYDSHQKGKMMIMIMKSTGSQVDSPVAEGNRKEGGGRKMRDLHKDT